MLIIAAPALVLQVDREKSSEAEIRLGSIRRALPDQGRSAELRASIALDEAASLVRDASSAGVEERRRRSGEAIALLDEFNAAHPRHSLEFPLALQAAVFAWSDGRLDLDASRLRRQDADLRRRAIDRLEDAVGRLDRIEPGLGAADPLVAQNARYRLAQALADRASLEPISASGNRARLRRAVGLLDPAPTEPSLAGFASLLSADLLSRLGEYPRAEVALDRAARAAAPPPAILLAEVRTATLIGARRYPEATRAIDASGLDEVDRGTLALTVRLAQRADSPDAPGREAAEAAAFAIAGRLRDSARPEARRAIDDLALAIDRPSPAAEPEAWDLLSDGAAGLGDSSRAARLASLGADRADQLDRPEVAGRLRLRAGGLLFQAGRYVEAVAPLDLAWNNARTGPARPKAGLLRCLALGRALAERDPAASRSAYVNALRDQVREYPTDSSTAEARWLLGAVEAERGRPLEAIAEWKAIPVGHLRWLASRIAIAAILRAEIEESRIGGETAATRSKFREAAAFLREAARTTTDPAQAFDLDLEMARLDLTPGVGRPELARSLLDRLCHQAGTPRQLAQARALRVVALAMTRRFVEAETEARLEIKASSTGSLLMAARLLDRAGSSEADAIRSRFGRLIRLLTDAIGRAPDGLAPADQAELHLRSIRGALLAGNVDLARREVRSEAMPDPDNLSPELLRDYSDALIQLEAYGLAVPLERLRVRKLEAGSPSWLESRYRLALALYHENEGESARAILDATAILYPGFGGGTLQLQFERLRQRLSTGGSAGGRP